MDNLLMDSPLIDNLLINSPLLSTLLEWTPAFASGFSLNIAISIIAMLMGTGIGWLIAKGRLSNSRSIAASSHTMTGVFRNIPSFVLMFYIAFIIPIEFEWNGQLYRFPLFLKAALALAVPVIGFTSDQFFQLIKALQKDNKIALPMFFVSWAQYFVIIIMASSTASVIGVNEIVGRANTAIAVTQNPSMMLWFYLYVSLWFFISAVVINYLLSLSSNYIKRQITE